LGEFVDAQTKRQSTALVERSGDAPESSSLTSPSAVCSGWRIGSWRRHGAAAVADEALGPPSKLTARRVIPLAG